MILKPIRLLGRTVVIQWSIAFLAIGPGIASVLPSFEGVVPAMRSRFLKVLALALVVVGALQLRAQDSSSITGTVTDATGGVLPGAQVTLTNPATGVTYRAVTTSLGAYTIQNVPAGPGYKITFDDAGFKPVTITDLYLNVSATRTQNVRLAVGATSQSVEVSAASENVTVDTTDATIGNNFEVQMVNELPVQIRDTPAALFVMQPGVSERTAAASIRSRERAPINRM